MSSLVTETEVEVVGANRPTERPACLGGALADPPAERARGGDAFVGDRDELEVTIPERDDSILGPPAWMTAGHGSQAVLCFEDRCRTDEVGDGDEDVIEPQP